MTRSPSQCSLNCSPSQFSYDFVLGSLSLIFFFHLPQVDSISVFGFLAWQSPTSLPISALSAPMPTTTVPFLSLSKLPPTSILSPSFLFFFLPHQLFLPGFLPQPRHHRWQPPILLSSSWNRSQIEVKRRKKREEEKEEQYRRPRSTNSTRTSLRFLSLILLEIEYSSCEALR